VLNASDYGNAASMFTGRGADARKFRHETDVGNVGTVAPMAFFHFGGRKDSFFGDLHAQAQDMIYRLNRASASGLDPEGEARQNA
jgi:malonate-semialdehyde dehydrogenase (acetylating)/methylmalonate-semialdehyde dehydrogenase